MPHYEAGDLVWEEPAFFRMRTLSKASRLLRTMTLPLMILWCALAYFLIPGEREKISVSQFLLRTCLISVTFTFWFDLLWAFREIAITRQGIKYWPSLMPGLIFVQHWNRVSLSRIRLLGVSESENRFSVPVMILEPKYGSTIVLSVPEGRLQEVAERLQSLGYEVIFKRASLEIPSSVEAPNSRAATI